MKKFKEMYIKEDALEDMAQGYLRKKEEWQPDTTVGQIAKGAIYGGPSQGQSLTGAILGTTWEIIDPSGVASYDDATEAFLTWRKHPNPWTFALYLLNLFNCIPNVGLIIAGGAAATGVGAPAAAGGAVVGAGWAGARGVAKYMIKKGAKHPEKVIEVSSKLMKLVSKTPGGPESMKKVSKDIGATADELAEIEKAVGSGTGVKLTGEVKPKPFTPEDIKKMSPEDKIKWEKSFAKTLDDTINGLAKKIKENPDPRLTSLINRQKHYRSEEMVKAAAESGIKLTGKEADYGVPKTLAWIIQSPTDDDVAKVLGDIAKENRISVDDVLEAIRRAHPDLDLPKIPKFNIDDAAAAIKTPDEAVKTAEKALEPPPIPAKEPARGAKSPHSTKETPWEKRLGYAKSYAKLKATTEVGKEAASAGRGLAALILGFFTQKFKMKVKIGTNIANPFTAFMLDALDRSAIQTAKREQYMKDNPRLYPGQPLPAGGVPIPSDTDKDEKPEG